MRTTRALVIGSSAAAVLAMGVALRAKSLPLGVPGEWEWPRLTVSPLPLDLLLAAFGILAYSGFAALGFAALQRPGRWREARWVGGLFLASVLVQVAAQYGAPEGYGLTKWVSLAMRGSSGYFDVARSPEMRDPWRFWAEFPGWVRGQDALHIGTHPPGLFLASRGLLGAMGAYPEAARLIAAHLPSAVDSGFRFLAPGLPPHVRAAVASMGGLTLLGCSATVAPLYLLARANLTAKSSWAAAAMWPLLPSAILFQPTADTAFPLLAATALALAARGGPIRSAIAGVALGVGMQFTLAFLPVGLAVAILLAWRPAGLRSKVAAIAATGGGFLAITFAAWGLSGANPWIIWWWNQGNHSRFYLEYPKSYAPWVIVNPIELAVAIGLPTSILATVGFATRSAPRSSWAGLIVLAILNFSGRNLSEVARLWLPLMPMLLVAAGAALDRVGGGAKMLGGMVAMTGAQTLLLQATIQVVYPA